MGLTSKSCSVSDGLKRLVGSIAVPLTKLEVKAQVEQSMPNLIAGAVNLPLTGVRVLNAGENIAEATAI